MSDAMGTALAELVIALDGLKIRYAVGGSLASSAHGAMRATFDADLIAMIGLYQLKPLCAALGKGWYADEEMMEGALRQGRAFNLIHIGSAIKVDVFPATSAFHQVQMERAQRTLLQPPVSVECVVTTAEDILLAKLRWYADGGQVSDRQWNDITGLIATNASLEWDYVNEWAGQLGVADLLEKARVDAAL
jgi:hypothetical protein